MFRPLFWGHDCGKASPPFQKLRTGKQVTIEHGGVSQIHSIAISTCHNNQVTARIFTRRKAHDYRGPLIRNGDDLVESELVAPICLETELCHCSLDPDIF